MPTVPFTSQNAAEMARRSHLPTSARVPVTRKQKPASNITGSCDENARYADKTLSRVRVQLDLVNTRLTEQLKREVIDPQAIDRLAAAQSRLSEQERILAGRPMPGSLKPSTRQEKRRPSAPDADPQPSETPLPAAYDGSSPDAPNG